MAEIQMLDILGTLELVEINPPPKQDPERFRAYITKPVVVVAGYGGWSRIARPRRKALTEWVGRDSMSLEIEFLTDVEGEFRGDWNERNIRSLERLAGIDIQDPQPPLFKLHSRPDKLIPHGVKRASHVDWFVDALTWDKESILTSTNGNRTRAGGVMTVTQFVADERLTPSVRRRGDSNRSRTGGKKKTHTVRAGETLSEIAKAVYGKASRWKEIAKANGIRDPKKLRVGQELKIP